MKRLKDVLDVDFKQLTKKKWDNVLLITGDEGNSKSTLGLHILDYWYSKLNGKTEAKDIKHVALTMKDFFTDLKDLKRYEMIIYDEAGELSNLRVMNKFNYNISQAFMVIRGLNIYTILILPSVFDLNPFFSKRRARGLINVYKRGCFAFWNKKKLRQAIALNSYRRVKTIWKVKPLWYERFPHYKGVLAEPYKKKKKEKINEVRQRLYDDLYNDELKENEKREAQKVKKILAAEPEALDIASLY